MIKLRDVISEMRRKDRFGEGVPFSIEVVSCNRKTGEAGRRLVYENAVLAAHKKNVVQSARRTRKQTNPHHWDNRTANIVTENKQIRKIHLDLIIYFNNKKVIL